MGIAPSASAEDTGHVYSFSFKGSGTNELGSFLGDVAIRQSTGDVYVIDSQKYRVEVFDSTGAFKFMFGKEVNATTKGFTCTSAETCQAGQQANPPAGIFGANHIAIDQVTGTEEKAEKDEGVEREQAEASEREERAQERAEQEREREREVEREEATAGR